jgi:hypothetical protein
VDANQDTGPHAETAVRIITSAGDPFFACAPTVYASMVPSERDKLIRQAHARAYREELRSLAAQGVEPVDLEDD